MDALNRLLTYSGEIGCACLADEPMSAHTSFKIGGNADLFLKPQDEETAAALLRRARALDVPVTIVGKGSDLLVSDRGIRGAVLALDELSAVPELLDETTISCPAGASLTALCVFAQRHGLTGLEFAYGIPGSVGGAVYMNAGAYGGEICNVLTAARYLDADANAWELPASALALSYRHSWFTDHPGCLITRVVFRLQKAEHTAIRARMDELMARRVSKQPLEYPSAGSTFKRPQGAYASALIDECGLKGLRVGGAMVSEKHAGFVINYDRATCADVLALVEQVRQAVHERTGYLLECEIKPMGESG